MWYKFFYIFAWVYTILIGLFSLDVKIFSLGFLIHQIPFLVLVVINIISLKKPKLSGILYLIMFLIFTLFLKTYKNYVVFLVISLPLFLFGILFFYKKNMAKKVNNVT